MQHIGRCTQIASQPASELLTPESPPSPTRRARSKLTFSMAITVTGFMNTYLKAGRAAITILDHWIYMSGDFLTFVRFTKVVASIRGILSIKRFIVYSEQAIRADTAVVRIKAIWLSFKNGKKVVSSVAWFANVFKDFELLKPEQVSWTTYVGSVQVPFQAVALSLRIVRLAKIGLIWIDLQTYKSDSVKACNYIAEHQDRLVQELHISLDYMLGERIRSIQRAIYSKSNFQYEMAKEMCDALTKELITKAKGRVMIASISCASRALAFAATLFDTVKPLPLLTSSLLTLTVTSLKTIKYFLNRRDVPDAKAA